MTRAVTVTQNEVTRYLRAMRAAGCPEGCLVIERPDGVKVSVMPGGASEDTTAEAEIDRMIERTK